MNIDSTKNNRFTWRLWLLFWVVALFLLGGWYIFLQIENKNIANLKPFLKLVPIGSQRRTELEVLADIFQKMGGLQGEKNILILFQNDMELRPGGGFIGSFGVLSAKNGSISDLQIFDTGVFDKNIPAAEAPPEPIKETFRINSWKMRDSNWSPDFRINAEKAEQFYRQGGGKEKIDGVVAINTNVLNSIIEATGPVKLEDYPGEYTDETAILQLEYQVEKGYQEQGIEKAERKSVMKEMADVLLEKTQMLSLSAQLGLAKKIEEHLDEKNIQVYLKDEKLQAEIENLDWGGRVKEAPKDYLMIVDANLNSLKSDICIKRSVDYSLDLRSENPQATLKIRYEHTCRTRDWMTTNYNNWLRVYVPSAAWLEGNGVEAGDVKFLQESGKNVFGQYVYVPIGESKTVELKYNFPHDFFASGNYELFVQKQSGAGEIPVSATLIRSSGKSETKREIVRRDTLFEF